MLRYGTPAALPRGVSTVILSAVLALAANLRALSDGYTDEAAFGRAITIFATVFVSVHLVRLAWRALRSWRRAAAEAVPVETGADVSAPLAPAYPPRRLFLGDEHSGDRNRAA